MSYLQLSALVGALSLVGCSNGATQAKLESIKPGMSSAQVVALLGRPERIDQSEMTGLRGEVDYYMGTSGTGEIVLLNDAVFQAQFVPKERVP